MMPLYRAEQLVWGMTALAVVSGALVVHRALSSLTLQAVNRSVSSSSGGTGVASIPRVAEGRVRTIVEGDLFRRERRAPDSVAVVPKQVTAPPPAAPKPRLVLKGLVGGPPWDAIVEGLPGHEGSYVVRAGDSVSGFKIRSVRRDGATIRGMDTTWTLKLQRAP